MSDGPNGLFTSDGGGTATLGNVFATWSASGGASSDSGTFDLTPSEIQISDGLGGSSNSEDVEFTGANGMTYLGAEDISVTLDFNLDLAAFSNSNIAFPIAEGDEMSIRLGKSDTIDNKFSAGRYPGLGSRDIAVDGHFVMANLVTLHSVSPDVMSLPEPEPEPAASLAAQHCSARWRAAARGDARRGLGRVAAMKRADAERA